MSHINIGNNPSGLPAIDTITGNSGGAVGADSSNNVNISGGTTGLTFVGNPATHTETMSGVLSAANGGTGENNGTSTLTLAGPLATSGAFSSTFTMTGATNVTFPTSGTLSTSTGTVTSVSGTPNQVGVATGTTTPIISLIGPYTPATYTAHGVLIGEGTSSIVSITPNATVGTPFVSNGAGSDPGYSTNPVVTEITINGTVTNATDAATKAYVDNAIASVNPGTSVYAASTASIAGTYTPVGSGIGDTFTTTSTATFTIDGTTPAVGSRILFKNQSTTFQNGVYTLTVEGNGVTGSILTRALDYDQPSDINSTGIIAVVNGTANMNTGWLLNVVVSSVGSSPITYQQYNSAPISVTQYNAITGGAGNTLNSVAPSATSGVPLISQGASSQPVFGTAVVAGGGTGQTTLTNHGVLVGAGTSGITQLGTGTAGQLLQSGGSTGDPAYSTSTYPTTNAVNTLLYASSANTMAALATANNGVLFTNGSGVPSIGTAPIVAGGTNATSFGTSQGVVVYNGTSLVNYGTNTISSGGIVTNTAQPALYYYLQTGATNATGDGTVYTLGSSQAYTKLFDQGNNFNTNGTFTAPVAGVYLISLTVGIGNLSSGHTQCNANIIISSGGEDSFECNPFAIRNTGSGNATVNLTAIYSMSASTTATFTVSVAGSTKSVTIGTGNNLNSVSITKLC